MVVYMELIGENAIQTGLEDSSTSLVPEDPNLFKSKFTEIYVKNFWTYGSGPGSTIEVAEPFRYFLQDFLEKAKISKMLDFGCGDWQYMRTVKFPKGMEYTGVDVYDAIIDNHNKIYAQPNVKFFKVSDDFLNELENNVAFKANLLVIKDVMQHWPNHVVFNFIKNILPNFDYALMINDSPCYKQNTFNTDTGIGGYHYLSLLDRYFKFPQGSKNSVLFYFDNNVKEVILWSHDKDSSAYKVGKEIVDKMLFQQQSLFFPQNKKISTIKCKK